MKNNNIFERYEIKYLISSEQKRLLMRAMEGHMKPDEYEQAYQRLRQQLAAAFSVARAFRAGPIVAVHQRMHNRVIQVAFVLVHTAYPAFRCAHCHRREEDTNSHR